MGMTHPTRKDDDMEVTEAEAIALMERASKRGRDTAIADLCAELTEFRAAALTTASAEAEGLRAEIAKRDTTIHQQAANAATAAREYVDRVAAKDAEIERLRAFVEDLAKQWLPGEPEPFDDFDPAFDDAYEIIVKRARAIQAERAT